MKNLTIVVCDDMDDERKVACELLGLALPEYDLRLLEGKNFMDLVKLTLTQKPQIILTDHNMKIGDHGTDGLRVIRGAGVNTPAIIVSGRIEQAEQANYNGGRIDNVYFLPKPYSTQELRAGIQKALPQHFS